MLPFSDKPTAPRNPKASDLTESSVTLTWDAPEDNGGCDINQYAIERREANRRTFQIIGTSKERSLNVTRLQENVPYIFQIMAENECGRGPAVEIGPITPKSQFGKPKNSLNIPNKPSVEMCLLQVLYEYECHIKYYLRTKALS